MLSCLEMETCVVFVDKMSKATFSKVVLVLDLALGNANVFKVGFLSGVIGVVDSSTNSVPGLWAGS